MANPALIKAAVVLLTDKRTWKAIGVVIAAILTPFILLVVIICSMLSGTANHNNAAVELTFYGGSLPITMPSEYKDYITEMRDCFSSLDGAIATVEGMMEDGDSLDSNRIKAVFYALNFGTEDLSLRRAKAREFVDCFAENKLQRLQLFLVKGKGDFYLFHNACSSLPSVECDFGFQLRFFSGKLVRLGEGPLDQLHLPVSEGHEFSFAVFTNQEKRAADNVITQPSVGKHPIEFSLLIAAQNNPCPQIQGLE